MGDSHQGALHLRSCPLAVGDAWLALPDFYNIAVGIANVAAGLAVLALWLGNKLGSSTTPAFVARLNIGNADIHKAADGIGAGGDAERDRRFVGCRTAADVEDDPRVRDLDVAWSAAAVAPAENATSEDLLVKSSRSFDVRNGEKVRDGKAILRRHLIVFLLDFDLAHGRLPSGYGVSPFARMRARTWPQLFCLLVQRIHQKLGGRAGRGRILPGDQLAISDGVDVPVLHLAKDRAEAHQLVLDEEGHHFRQSYRFLFAIGEAGHGLAGDERLAVRGLDMPQRAGRVADQREGLAGGDEGFDQLDRVLVFGEIPHRPVSAGVEDGIVIFLLDAIEAHRLVELGVGGGVLFEPPCEVGLEVRLVALGIEGRTPTLGGSEGDLNARILEDIVRRRQFLEPEAGLAAGVAELVVGSKNHQDFHDALLDPWSLKSDPR